MREFPFIKIDGIWWEVADAEFLLQWVTLRSGFLVRVENQVGGYHFHRVSEDDEVKFFVSKTEAWQENAKAED